MDMKCDSENEHNFINVIKYVFSPVARTIVTVIQRSSQIITAVYLSKPLKQTLLSFRKDQGALSIATTNVKDSMGGVSSDACSLLMLGNPGY